MDKADKTPRQPDFRCGSKADICSAKRHVRFAPESDMISLAI